MVQLFGGGAGRGGGEKGWDGGKRGEKKKEYVVGEVNISSVLNANLHVVML